MSKGRDKFIFKITVIGDGAVGKTSLIQRYTQKSFKEDYIKTIGAQFSEHEFDLEGAQIKVFFWDIAGQDEFHFLRPTFYKGSNAAIIVFSLEENKRGQTSYEHVKNWHNDFKKHCGDLPVMLFGNKVDLVDEKILDEDKVQKLVRNRGFISYYKTSAKTGDRVNEAFKVMIKELYNKYKDKR